LGWPTKRLVLSVLSTVRGRGLVSITDTRNSEKHVP
jgi:hypothetical protein